MMACAKLKTAWMRFQAQGCAAKRRALAANEQESLDVTVRTDTNGGSQNKESLNSLKNNGLYIIYP